MFVDRFPPIDGVPEAPVDLQDAETGLLAEKTIYVAKLSGAHRLLTHVVRTRCGAWASEPGWNVTIMVAQQMLPGAVASARDADARNRFFAVYALDESGRIRRYLDLSVIDLTELTRRTLPSCPAL